MEELQRKYGELLIAYLDRPDEGRLYEGYVCGKLCSEKGAGVSEVIRWHFAALEGRKEKYGEEILPASQEFLLETTMAMCVSGGMKTMESVLAALYDETLKQFRELQEAKKKLQGYSQNLEEKVREKLYELQIAEEKFETLVQTIPDIVYKIDRTGNFAYLNEAINTLGYTPQELLGRHFSEIILAPEVEAVSSSHVLPRYLGRKTEAKDAPKLFDERRTGARKTSGLEVQLLLKSGRTRPAVIENLGRQWVVVEISSSGLHELNRETRKKEYVGTVGVIRDITERKKVEKKLRDYQVHLEELVAERTAALSKAVQELRAEVAERQRTENSLQNILESMGEGLIVIDHDYRIIRANKSYAAQLDKSPAEIIGKKCHAVSHGQGEPCFETGEECPAHYTFATGQPYLAIHEHRDDRGHALHLEVKSYPIKDPDGQISSVIEIVNDVTEKQKMEEQLRQAQKMEALGALAGGIAHDFNNILVPILGYAELLMRDVPADSQMQADLSIVHQAALRATNLVKQILTYSRQTKQERTPLSLGPIIKEGLKLLKASLPANIELKQVIATRTDMVLADPTEIHQVVMNLCTNAYHAMKKAGGILEVRLENVEVGDRGWQKLTTLPVGHYLRLTVSDTGCGMDKAIQARMFEPYFTTKKKGEGTGLGLAIVHAIVSSYGGGIVFSSKAGKGTTFDLFFPELTAESPKETGTEAETLPRGNERILLVDDEKSVIEFVTRGLEAMGYQVKGMMDSQETLAAFQAAPETFDLVITDQTMPKMTGDQLVVKLLETRPDIPILLCTGYSSIIDESRAKAIGVRKFLYKPLALKELIWAVRRVLDGQE